MHPLHIRRMLAAIAALLLATISALVASSPAHAVTYDLSCVGQSSQQFDPGITYTEQEVDVDVSDIYNVCVIHPQDITGGSNINSLTVTSSCLQVLDSGTGTKTYTWSNSQQSVFSFTRTVTHSGVSIIFTRTGTITSGRFAGSSAVEVVTIASTEFLQCATTGVTSFSGVATLQIIAL